MNSRSDYGQQDLADRSMREIYLTGGKEYEAVREKINNPTAFFYDSYQMASFCLEEILNAEILNASKDMLDRCLEDRDSASAINHCLLSYPSNVIAFCASRGQGKTSAMDSFGAALEEISPGNGNDNTFFESDSLIGNNTYCVLPSIDPTMMNDSDSIIQLLLTRLFSNYQEELNAKSNQYNEMTSLRLSQIRLSELFQKCFHDLQIISGKESQDWNDDELETIMEQSDSTNLRGILYILIANYLKFVRKSQLVICIDDADMQTSVAYQIIDSIRKYLVMPKVIVLMAVNIDQLFITVKQHFLADYEKTIILGEKGQKEKINRRCEIIAGRYIEKVIPGNRRIYLPDIGTLLVNDYKYIKLIHKTGEKEDNWFSNGNYFQDQLLKFIHEKTGICFIPYNDCRHNFLPTTLRDLSHMVAYFGRLDSLGTNNYRALAEEFLKESGGEVNIQAWRENLNAAKQYLLSVWSPLNLDENASDFMMTLGYANLKNKNRLVLDFLPDYYAYSMMTDTLQGSMTDFQKRRQEFIEECKKRGTFLGNDDRSRATYAEVSEALCVLAELQGTDLQQRFVSAIGLYYTIFSHELLLDMLEKKRKEEEERKMGLGKDQPLNLDNLESDSLKASSITGFLNDFLFTGIDPSGKNDGTLGYKKGGLLLHYHFKTADLLKNINLIEQSDSEKMIPNAKIEYNIWVNIFTREEINSSRENFTTWHNIYSEKRDRFKQEDDSTRVFNLFYPVFSCFDMIDREIVRQNSTDLSENKGVQALTVDKLINAFEMLNWDIQLNVRDSLLNYKENEITFKTIFHTASTLITDLREKQNGKKIESTYDHLENAETDYQFKSQLAIAWTIPELQKLVIEECLNSIKTIISMCVGVYKRMEELKNAVDSTDKNTENKTRITFDAKCDISYPIIVPSSIGSKRILQEIIIMMRLIDRQYSPKNLVLSNRHPADLLKFMTLLQEKMKNILLTDNNSAPLTVGREKYD